MTDYEVASALNIIAEAHNSRTTYIDIANRYVLFEGPEDQEIALSIAVENFMSTVEYMGETPTGKWSPLRNRSKRQNACVVERT